VSPQPKAKKAKKAKKPKKMDMPDKRRKKKDKAKEKFQRNGAYSTKHVRIAKEQRAKK
jgi:hypothetical protein